MVLLYEEQDIADFRAMTDTKTLFRTCFSEDITR